MCVCVSVCVYVCACNRSSQQSLISARSAPVPSDSPSQAAVSKQAWAEPASLSTTPTHTGSTAAAPGTLDFSSVDPQVCVRVSFHRLILSEDARMSQLCMCV